MIMTYDKDKDIMRTASAPPPAASRTGPETQKDPPELRIQEVKSCQATRGNQNLYI